MIRSLMSLGALLLILVAGVTLGAPFTTSFDALRADLQNRRDADYSGVLSRTQKKELAAINACLANLDAPHATIADDAKSLKFVAKKLVKPFSGQFTGATPGTLPGLLAGVVTHLLGDAETVFGTLQATIDAAVDPAHRQQASALAAQARADLDEAALPATAPIDAAALVIKAAKAIATALFIADDAPPSGVRCKIGSDSFVATAVEATGSQGAGVVSITVTAHEGANEALTLHLTGELGAVLEIGGFQFPFGGNYCLYNPDGGDDSFFYSQVSPTSFARITSFDAATGSVSGSFSVYLKRSGSPRLQIKKGVFNLTGVVIAKR